MGNKRSSNDNRTISKKPNNPAYKAPIDNRAIQKNQNNPKSQD